MVLATNNFLITIAPLLPPKTNNSSMLGNFQPMKSFLKSSINQEMKLYFVVACVTEVGSASSLSL
jgi:hypothetical protein